MDNKPRTVDNLINSTLASLGVPVERLRFTGEADTYITFQLLNGQEAEHADDEEIAYEHYYRGDIFSKGNYLTLLQQMKKALKAAGFYGITVNAEMYENDTALYHVSLDFYYMEVCNHENRTT